MLSIWLCGTYEETSRKEYDYLLKVHPAAAQQLIENRYTGDIVDYMFEITPEEAYNVDVWAAVMEFHGEGYGLCRLRTKIQMEFERMYIL